MEVLKLSCVHGRSGQCIKGLGECHSCVVSLFMHHIARYRACLLIQEHKGICGKFTVRVRGKGLCRKCQLIGAVNLSLRQLLELKLG